MRKIIGVCLVLFCCLFLACSMATTEAKELDFLRNPQMASRSEAIKRSTGPIKYILQGKGLPKNSYQRFYLYQYWAILENYTAKT